MKTFFLFVFCFLSSVCFSQQTEEFKLVKNYYNQHRNLLNNEFKKKFDAEPNLVSKASIKQDFLLFMRKMDSIENTALIGALLQVKNSEDLKRLGLKNKLADSEIQSAKTAVADKTADYPGGINTLRQEIAGIFYSDAVYSESSSVKTDLAFIVEKDGTVTNVQAYGDNFTLNRQAEIALYSIPKKFSPAIIQGYPVRYRFRLPLVLNIE